MLDTLKQYYMQAYSGNFRWHELHANNMLANPLEGYYTYFWFYDREDKEYTYVKYTITFQGRVDETCCEHPDEGTKFYILHRLKATSKTKLKIPDPVPKDEYCGKLEVAEEGYFNHLHVNVHGDALTVFDNFEIAKESVRYRFLHMIYPFTYIMTDEEGEEWNEFVKSHPIDDIQKRRTNHMKKVTVKNSSYRRMINDAEAKEGKSILTTPTKLDVEDEVIIYPCVPTVNNDYIYATVTRVSTSQDSTTDIPYMINNNDAYRYSIVISQNPTVKESFIPSEFFMEYEKKTGKSVLGKQKESKSQNSHTIDVINYNKGNLYLNILPNSSAGTLADEARAQELVYKVLSKRLAPDIIIPEIRYYTDMLSCKEVIALEVPEGFVPIRQLIESNISVSSMQAIAKKLANGLLSYQKAVDDYFNELYCKGTGVQDGLLSETNLLASAFTLYSTDKEYYDLNYETSPERLQMNCLYSDTLSHNNFTLDNIFYYPDYPSKLCFVGFHNASFAPKDLDIVTLEDSFREVITNPEDIDPVLCTLNQTYLGTSRQYNAEKYLEESKKWIRDIRAFTGI